MKSKIRFQVLQSEEGMRLDAFLAQKLGTEISRAKVRKILLAGVIRVNGRVRPPSFPLRAESVVEGDVDHELLHSDAPSRQDRLWRMSKDSIVYEDEFLIVIDKPFGLPTQPTLDPRRPSLFGELKRFMEERDGPEAYVGLHHRLDRDTSGLVLFTKSREANKGVSDLFKNHEIRKSYLAIGVCSARGPQLKDEFEVRNFLRKDSLKKGRMRVVRAGGDLAVTRFRILDRQSSHVLTLAEPMTGRMHQIRVHLSESGCPILGDETYGRAMPGVRLALHAAFLTFKHPITSLKTEVRAPIPPDFQACLKQTGLTLPSEMRAVLAGG